MLRLSKQLIESFSRGLCRLSIIRPDILRESVSRRTKVFIQFVEMFGLNSDWHVLFQDCDCVRHFSQRRNFSYFVRGNVLLTRGKELSVQSVLVSMWFLKINEDGPLLIYQVKSCLVRFWWPGVNISCQRVCQPGFLSGFAEEAGAGGRDTELSVGISL